MVHLRQINEHIQVGLLNLDDYALHTGITMRRELEKTGALFLLEQLIGYNTFELAYTVHRKPYLVNSNLHISISHSHSMLAIICNSKEATGIDIELIRDKVKQIEHKFLSAAEQLIAGQQTETLISFWAAKESLYKVYGLKEIDFKKHLFIDSYTGTELVTRIETNGLKKKYLLACETINNYKLVYIKHEI